MELKPGNRLRSAVNEVEVVVIRSPAGDVDLRCGGVPMVEAQGSSPKPGAAGQLEGSVALGKRYVDDGEMIEILCTKPGAGTLAVGDQTLEIKNAKPLPASD